MLQPKMRWTAGSPDPSAVRELMAKLGIGPLLAALLAARGYTAEEAAFLLSGELHFHDPLQMRGMPQAADRIRKALQTGEKILIYGDYDADGVCSTALLSLLFRTLGAKFDVRIPDRKADGYGIHCHYLEEAARDGVSLVVTVDTGITAKEQAEWAKTLGLDLVITDHHEPPAVLPRAAAVVNPKQPDCTYPFKGLAGVGVAFKLAQALLGRVPEEWSPWAALGTVADLMPLTGENRSIVRLGLDRLRSSPPPCFAALLRTAGLRPEDVSAHTLGFVLAPRINAAGRLESADIAYRLLTTDSLEEAEAAARRLDKLNQERQRLVDEAAAEAIGMVERGGGPAEGIVVASENWNPGIIGIVASKLVEHFVRPAVVISFDPDTGLGKGSARAVPGFDLYDALSACSNWFVHFGGHESAAGLTLHRDNYEGFAAQFLAEAAARFTPEMARPVMHADAELKLSDISLEAVAELDKLAPYGMSHPAPRFIVRPAAVVEASVIGKDRRHARYRLSDGQAHIDAVGFGLADTVPRIAPGSRMELLAELSINEWNGKRTPQLIVKDVAIPHIQLFDWRDAATSAAMNAKWNQAAFPGWQPAFLLGPYDDPPAALLDLWAEVPAYRMKASGDEPAVPANRAARQIPFRSCTDLFLVSCPYPYERFHQMLKLKLSLERLYALDLGGAGVLDAPAGRERLKRVYVAMRSAGREASEDEWVRWLDERHGISACLARLALDIFRELQFVEEGEEPGTLRMRNSPEKRDLAESPSFVLEQRAARARQEWRRAPCGVLLRRLLGEKHEHGPEMEFETMEALG